MAETLTLVIFLCVVIFVMGLASGLNEEPSEPIALMSAFICLLGIILVTLYNPMGVKSYEPIQPILEIKCKGEPDTGIVCDTTYIYKH